MNTDIEIDKKNATLHLNCRCENVGHMVVISLDEDLSVDDDDRFGPYSDLFIHSQLSSYLPWWKRISVALKYVFNMNRDAYADAHWNCCMIKEEDIPTLLNLIQRHKKSNEFIKEWWDNKRNGGQ